MRIVAALLALAFLASGCATKTTDSPTGGTMATVPNGACGALLCNATVTVPHVDARKTLDDLKAFSQAFPYRQSGNPSHVAARDDLEARFTAAGLPVLRQSFERPLGANLPVVAGPTYTGQNVIGIKWGAQRDHFVVIGAHYDVTEGAIYGTYDDGSGTALVFELAAAFAHVATDRTILFCEFDQEELGLVGSAHLLSTFEDHTFPYNGTIDAMLDLDMIGITYPHPAKMVVWQNSPEVKGLVTNLTAAAKVPAAQLEFRKTKGGTSDGATFIAAGIPTAYFWSDWDEYSLPNGQPMPYVGLYVGAYPWWHKVDTYDTMVLAAGNEATLQAGFQTTLDVVSPTLATFASAAFQPTVATDA